MKNIQKTVITIALSVFAFTGNAQTSSETQDCPLVGGACYTNTATNKTTPNPLNGNGSLGQIYNVNKCGLNYVHAERVLWKRGTTNPPIVGANQPATFTITGLPTCYVVERAYIYASMSGTSLPLNITIVNPALVSNTFPAVTIGTGADKCWGYGGTTSFRVDVTSAISGNGNYLISGWPTNPPTPQKDTDGASLFIIYSDPTAAYEGHMVINDGCCIQIGGTNTQTMSGIAACANSTFGRAFAIFGDLQPAFSTGGSQTLANTPNPGFTMGMFDWEQVACVVTAGQNTATYSHFGPSDCFNFMMMGLYYRTTTCTTCPSSSSNLTLTPNSTQPTCNLCNGVVGVTVTGGTAPYTYSWVPGNNTTSSVSNLCAGTYTVYVFDAGCNQASITITLNSVNAVITSTNSTTPALCFGSCTGTGTSVPSGGTAPYTYSWYTVPSQNTATATGLCAGTYSVLVTDANGCTVVTSVTITQPTAVTGSITGTTQPSCFGGANGTATAQGAGGTPGYTYNWTPVGGTGQTGTGLSAGITYTCTITDANGCTGTVTVVLTQPPALTVQATGFAETCTGACDGQVVCIPAGGTAPYSYLWSSGCTTPGCLPVCSGTYTITVTDANGCTIQDTAIVSSPPGLTLTSSSTPALCGQANGSATVVATGGTPGYTYAWAPIGGTSATATGLNGGPYTVIVTDANGCSATATVVVANPAPVTAGIPTQTDVSCFGLCDGTANCVAVSGTTPYVYSWTTVPSQNTANANNLCAGTYSCYVTDANGCVSIASITISQPTLLTVTASQAVAICTGVTTPLSGLPNGGTPGYTYMWSPGGPGQNITVSPTATQIYTLTITDANGCTATATTTVTVNPLPVFSITADDSDGCVTHCVNFATSISGATNYAWTYGDAGTGTGATPNHCYTTTGAFNVTLVVTDANGCVNTVTVNGMINVYPLPVADFTLSASEASITQPDITFTNTSVGASAYSWDFGDVASGTYNTSTVQNPTHTFTDTGRFCINLSVQSINGCRDSIEYCLIITPDFTFYAPNAITPDGDGINDNFFPQGSGWDLNTYQLYIFDRWGNLIFQTDDVTKTWNGKVQGGNSDDLVQEDTYVWKVVLKDFAGAQHQYVGHVSVIR